MVKPGLFGTPGAGVLAPLGSSYRMFEQALYEVVASLLPVCIMGMDIVSDWGMFHLPTNRKQKAYKSALQAILIGHAKWEPVRLPEPTPCGTEAGMPEGQILYVMILCGSMATACQHFPVMTTGLLD